MHDEQFIITADKETAEKLTSKGLPLFSVSEGSYVFINEGRPSHFSKDISSKIAYTNVLFC